MVLPAKAFASRERIAQLIDQRFITPLPEGAQPTVAALRSATVGNLELLVTQVRDACVIEEALRVETRVSAQKVLLDRLAAMGGAVQPETTREDN